MKAKLAPLLILLGGVIAGFNSSVAVGALAIPISLIGGFLVGSSFLVFTSVFSGTIWGVQIKASGLSMVKVLAGAVGLIFGGFAIVTTLISTLNLLTSGRAAIALIALVVYLILLAVGPMITKIFLEKSLAKENSANALDRFAIFQEIDANMDNATNFVVGFEGVALFSNTNYCYAVYRYEDYQLGELSSPNEVALVGTYFVQKYNDRYTFKVDMEVIPGTPGQTVVAVGTGGIGVARIQGTPDQRIFRSYIFTRKN